MTPRRAGGSVAAMLFGRSWLKVAGVAGFLALLGGVYLHFHDEDPPDMALFDRKFLNEPDEATHQARAATAARLTALLPAVPGGKSSDEILYYLRKRFEQSPDAVLPEVKATLAAYEPFIAAAIACCVRDEEPDDLDFGEYCFEELEALSLQAAALGGDVAALRAECDRWRAVEVAYTAKPYFHQHYYRSMELSGGARCLLPYDEDRVEASRLAKSREIAEVLLTQPMMEDGVIIRRWAAGRKTYLAEIKLTLDSTRKTGPADFPHAVDWSDFPVSELRRAVCERSAYSNLRYHATLREALSRQSAYDAYFDALARELPAVFPSYPEAPPWVRHFRYNGYGRYLLDSDANSFLGGVARALVYELQQHRLTRIEAAYLLYKWRHAGAAPKSLGELGLTASQLTDPYSGKPFEYDADKKILSADCLDLNLERSP